MRKFVMAAAVLVVVAASTASAQGVDKGQAEQGAGYPLFWRENFVRGCLDGPNGVPRSVCECGIRNIERAVPFQESQALDEASRAGRDPDPRTVDQYRQIMRQCMRDPTYSSS